jgi:exopolysaccharide production protein ExoQ
VPTNLIQSSPPVHLVFPTESEELSAQQQHVYKRALSWATVIPLLFLVANGQLSITSQYNNLLMTQSGDLLRTQQPIRPEVVLYYATMITFIFIGHRGIWRTALNNKLLVFAPALAALSAFWSESRFLTLRMSFELGMTTLFAFYLTEHFSSEEMMELFTLVGAIAGILSILLVIFLPTYGIYHRDYGGEWQGICNHKNSLGTGMAFLLTPIFYSRKRLQLKLAYGALMVFLILMSQSRGAWLVTAGVLSFAAWLALYKRLAPREVLLFIIVSAAAGVTMIALALAYLEPLTRMIGKDPTLTGRTQIYSAVLESIMKHPLLGYGFGAFWHGFNHESFALSLRFWNTLGYAENGFLEIWLELGVLGVALALLIILAALWRGFGLSRFRDCSPSVSWFVLLLVLELMTNIDAGVVMTPISLGWTLTIIACVGINRETARADRYLFI